MNELQHLCIYRAEKARFQGSFGEGFRTPNPQRTRLNSSTIQGGKGWFLAAGIWASRR